MPNKEKNTGAWVYVGLHQGKKEKVKNRADKQKSIPDIAMRSVCVSFGVTKEELTSRDRHQNIALARHAYCSMVRKFTRLTLREIGDLLGGRDHATILNGINVAEGLLSYDEQFQQVYDEALGLLIDECGMMAHVYPRS